MATNPACCGCYTADDYGTSLASGGGSESDPFTIEQVDPNFRRPMVRLSRSVTLTFIVPTVIGWTNVEFDTASMWDVGSPGDIVLPIDGLYLVGLQTDITASTGIRELIIQHNSVQVYNTEYQTAVDSKMALSYQIVGHANDTVNGALRTSGGVNLTRAVFWACYLGKVV